jgi:hypothetical protein
MIVVSDTTPLNYLVLIEAQEILPRLFSPCRGHAASYEGCSPDTLPYLYPGTDRLR